jgi:hypothetical protein
MTAAPSPSLRSFLVLRLLAFLSLLIPPGRAQETTTAARRSFSHPGMLHSTAEIEFVKRKIAAGEEPWRYAWSELRKSKYAAPGWRPRPRAEVERDQHHRHFGSNELGDDALAAYTHALQWALTRNVVHARKSTEILNAWSTQLQSIIGHDAKLLCGMTGYKFCNAAELLRHTGAPWPEAEQAKFRQMLTGIYLPIIRDFHREKHGSWDTSIIVTMMCIGVFCDDAETYNRTVEFFLKGDGPGALPNYVQPSGQCQESTRDQGHAQRGLGYLADACEVAWKQGDDLWAAHDSRLARGFEFLARYNLGLEVPADGKISAEERGRFRPIYEKVFRHYNGRKQLEMPFTHRALEKVRPEGAHWDHIPWGTLMFANQPPDPTQPAR